MSTQALISQNKRLIAILAIVAAMLMVPLIAMQFTAEVRWDADDFIIAGSLLLGAGLLIELALRGGQTARYRIGAILSIITALVLVWVNLAVGIIGSEDNLANLLYWGVLVTLLIGAGLSHLRPNGMAKTLFAAAIVQVLVPVVAMIILFLMWNPGLVVVLFFNTVFAGLWCAAGLLFHQAAGSPADL